MIKILVDHNLEGQALLPVITIGNPNRLSERKYRSQCVSRLVEILLDLDNYLGTARIFIP